MYILVILVVVVVVVFGGGCICGDVSGGSYGYGCIETSSIRLS